LGINTVISNQLTKLTETLHVSDHICQKWIKSTQVREQTTLLCASVGFTHQRGNFI